MVSRGMLAKDSLQQEKREFLSACVAWLEVLENLIPRANRYLEEGILDVNRELAKLYELQDILSLSKNILQAPIKKARRKAGISDFLSRLKRWRYSRGLPKYFDLGKKERYAVIGNSGECINDCRESMSRAPSLGGVTQVYSRKMTIFPEKLILLEKRALNPGLTPWQYKAAFRLLHNRVEELKVRI